MNLVAQLIIDVKGLFYCDFEMAQKLTGPNKRAFRVRWLCAINEDPLESKWR